MGDGVRERRTYEDPPSDGAVRNPDMSMIEPSYWETAPKDATDVTLGAVGMDQADTTDVTLGAGGGGPGIPGNTTSSASKSSSGTGTSAHDRVEARSTDANGDCDGRGGGGGCAWPGPEGVWDAKGEVEGAGALASSVRCQELPTLDQELVDGRCWELADGRVGLNMATDGRERRA